MENLIWPLIIASISGLTFMAYNHPESFRNNIGYPLLFLSIFLLVIGLSAYMGASEATINGLVDEVSKLDNKETTVPYYAEKIFNRFKLLKVGLMVFGAAAAYLVFLINLPRILSLENNRK